MTDADIANVVREIRALEDRRYQAMTDADIVTLEELLTKK